MTRARTAGARDGAEREADVTKMIYGVAQFEDGVMLPPGVYAGQWMVTGAILGDPGQPRIIAAPFVSEQAAREEAHRLIREGDNGR